MVSSHLHDNLFYWWGKHFTDGETEVEQVKPLAEPRVESEDDSGPSLPSLCSFLSFMDLI